MTTSILVQELEPLEAQIEQARQKQESLENELRIVEAELNAFSVDRQRFDALRDVCSALDKLGELEADDLFWEGISGVTDPTLHVDKVRSRIASFEAEISSILEKQQSLRDQIDQCTHELAILYEEVREAYDREERRKEEFVIEREVSPVPYRPMVMPWTKEADSERRFRRAILLALLLCFVFGAIIPLIDVPMPDRSATVVEIPERLVKLVKKEPPKPKPIPEPIQKQAKEEPKEEEPKPDQQKSDEPPKPESPKEEPTQLAANDSKTSAAREKAERVGVLKFKDTFADLMDDPPAAKLGTEASLRDEDSQIKGQAIAQRSLVAMQAQGGSSGGIDTAGVSRNLGNSNVTRLGRGGNGNGVGFVRAESSIANLEEVSRPMRDGLPPGRTDEEIQIVFDRYKATLYRIYNKELRKDPTLRGKILMRITIEPSGVVSMCKMESTDLASSELVDKIVARVKKFNFGPKEGVQKITILYPIDFLPAG